MAQLDIGQPFGDNIQQSRVQSNRGAHQCDDKPGLARIVGLAHFAPPSERTVTVPEPRPFSALGLLASLLVYSILDPVDGCEVLVTFDFVDFLGDGGGMAIVGGRRLGRRGHREA